MEWCNRLARQLAVKRIADPVHGTVGLSLPEVELLSSRAFQRLRNIKQLGLAHLVFPGADYSRLSHCIGVCHVTGKILEALRPYSDSEITDQEHQQYRLAGLLHDIGHFPFSHAFEDAVSNYYEPHQDTHPFITSDPQPGQVSEDQPTSSHLQSHEDVGRLLLGCDEEIRSVLRGHDISPDDIYSIFARVNPPRFANLVSSDLDADRIDYLLRTAQHTGLPYGTVDIDYILSQIRVDDENRICLTPQALRTAEHFLFGRFFDYQQVSYHKTVAAFEEVLKDVISELLARGIIDCSKTGIEDMVTSGAWYDFDDSYILQKIRALWAEVGDSDEVLTNKLNSLIRRSPPKLVGSIEFVDDRHKSNRDEHTRNIRRLNQLAQDLSSEFNIPRELWYVWHTGGSALTKVGSHAPVSMLPVAEDELGQSIRIHDGQKSRPIFEVPSSFLSILAQKVLYTARLYVLFPAGRETDRRRITTRAEQMVDHQYWVNGKS